MFTNPSSRHFIQEQLQSDNLYGQKLNIVNLKLRAMVNKSKQNKKVLTGLNKENQILKSQIAAVASKKVTDEAKLKTENFKLEADVSSLENQLLMLNSENSKLEILLGEQTNYNNNLKRRNDGFEVKI